MSKLIKGMAVVAVVLAPFAANAAQQAEVTARIAELRIKPSDNAPSRLKLAGGREVDVVGKSDDGRWIKVKTSFEKGDYLVALEGWLESSQLRATDGAELGRGAPSEAAGSGGDMFGGFGGSSGATTTDDSFGEDSGSSGADPWAADSGSSSEASSDPFADTASSSSSSSSEDPWASEGGSSDSGSSDSGSEDSGSGDDWGDF